MFLLHAGTGGTHFALADGAVQLLTAGINLGIYKSLASRDGGEVAALPQGGCSWAARELQN